MNQDIIPVSVRILGKEYQIACPKDERPSLLEAAKKLNQQMLEVQQSGVAGLDSIAVLCALNVTHEMMNAKDQPAAPAPTRKPTQQKVLETPITPAAYDFEKRTRALRKKAEDTISRFRQTSL